MADIFDTLTPKPEGDVFDQVAPPAASGGEGGDGGDIFDRLSPAAQPAAAPTVPQDADGFLTGLTQLDSPQTKPPMAQPERSAFPLPNIGQTAGLALNFLAPVAGKAADQATAALDIPRQAFRAFNLDPYYWTWRGMEAAGAAGEGYADRQSKAVEAAKDRVYGDTVIPMPEVNLKIGAKEVNILSDMKVKDFVDNLGQAAGVMSVYGKTAGVVSKAIPEAWNPIVKALARGGATGAIIENFKNIFENEPLGKQMTDVGLGAAYMAALDAGFAAIPVGAKATKGWLSKGPYGRNYEKLVNTSTKAFVKEMAENGIEVNSVAAKKAMEQWYNLLAKTKPGGTFSVGEIRNAVKSIRKGASMIEAIKRSYAPPGAPAAPRVPMALPGAQGTAAAPPAALAPRPPAAPAPVPMRPPAAAPPQAMPPAKMPANAPGLPQAAPQAPGRGAVAPAGEKAVAGATGAETGKQAGGEAAVGDGSIVGRTLYHGATKSMQGGPKTARAKESIKTRFGEMRVVGTVFDGFFLAKTPEYASVYSALDKNKVHPFHLAPDTKVLSLPDIVSEEVLTSRGMGRSNVSALPKPTQPFPFQSEFEAYAFRRLNQERQRNGKDPFTREQFNKHTAGEWSPASKEYDLEGMASKYLPDFIKAQGYDAIEMGREVVVLDTSKVVEGTAAPPQAAPQAPGRGAVAPVGEKAVAGATGAETGKQAWEMTIKELIKSDYPHTALYGNMSLYGTGKMARAQLANKFRILEQRHGEVIKQALAAGKPVPPEVLAEYLDLAKPAAKPERGLPGAGEGARAVERPLTAAETFGEEAPPSWEGSKLATDPRISEKRLVARKLDNGRYGLYYKDSGEEVFREHTFSSAPTARKYFRDQKELARADWEDRQAEKERSAELQEAEQGLGTPVLTWLRRRPPMHMGREGLDGELRLAKEEGLGSIIRAKRDPYKTTESIEHTLAAAVEQGYYEPGTSLSEFIEDVISNKRGERTTYPAFEGVAAPKGAVGQDEMDLGVDRENVSAAIDRRTKELVSAGAPAPAARQQAIREVAAQQTARTRQAQTPTAQPRQGALDLGHEDLPLFGGATAGAKPITQTEKANERKIKPAIRKLRTHLDRLRGKANFPGRDTPARKSRLARKLEAEGILFHDQGQIDAHVAAETFIAIRDPNIEQLMVVPTSKGVAPFAQCVSSGLPNATAFASKKGEAPLIRTVRRMNKWIEDYKIDEISIVHNHPGGSPYPSGWDKRDKGLVDDMRFFDYLRSQIPDSVTLNFVVTNGGYTILKWKKAALGLPVTEMSAKYDFKTPAQVYSPAGPVIEGVHHAAYEMIGMQGRKGWAEGVFATLLGPNNDSMGTFFFNERVLRKGNLPRAVGDLVKSRRAKSAIIGGFGLDLESVARGHSFDVAIDGVISISKDLSGYESAGVRGMMPVQAKQQGHPSRLFAEPQDISQDEQRVAPPASPFPATLPSEGAAPQPPPFKRPAPPDREMFEAMPWAVKPLFEMNENDWALVMALNREYLHMSRAQILNSIERMIPKLPGGAGEYETIRKRFFDPTANLDVSQWPTDDLTALALKMEVRTSDTIPPAIREQEAELDKFYDKLGAEKRKNITPRLWFTPFDVYSRQVSPAVTEKVVDPLRQTQRRAAVERQDALGAIGQMRKAVEKAAGIRGPFQQGKARELSTRLYKATEGLKAVGELPSILSQVEQDAIAAHNRDAEELLRAVNAVRELAGERPIKNWTRTGYIRHILKPDIVTAYHEKGALDPELAKIMDKIPKTGLHLGSAQHRLNLSPEMMDALFNQDFWQSWAVMVGEKIRYKNLRLTLEKVKPYIDIMRKHPEFDPNAFRMYDRWLEQNIKYRPGEIDGYLNGLFNGIIGMWNKAAPASMRKAAGTQPWRDVVDFLSQGMHVGALSMRLKPIIRNRIQSFLDWTMMGSQAYTNGRTMYHTKQGRALLNASDVFKSRIFVIGQEAASVKQVFDVMGAGYKWSDKKNVGQSILTAYWRYVNEYGMQEADKLPGGGKYSAAALKRAEQYMMDTQWSYFREDMPKVYWSSTGRLAFGLGSWPMSFWNRYVPEVFRRTFTGKDGRGEPVKGTERWAGLRFLLLLGATYALKEASKEVLGGKREVDYTSSVLPDPRFARPGGFGPGAMAAIGLWEALAGQSKWERERGWRLVKRSAMIHIPGYLGFKDIADVVNGEKDLIDYTFYTRKVKEGKPAPPAAPARRRAPVKRTRYAIYAPAQRAKR